jgi:aspartate/glutamate racemase
MIFEAAKGQTSYGEAIGILLLDTFCPFIRGDVGNAASYQYPVRFKRIDGLTVERIFDHDLGFVEKMIAGARELESEGVKAITGDCGFMAIYQKEVKESVNIPVFLSSLLQIPFIKSTLPDHAKIGVITANSGSLTPDVFKKIGVDKDPLVILGLEDSRHFKEAVFEEMGFLDSDRVREEVLSIVDVLKAEHPEVKSILLECSMLPPYGKDVRHAVNLPVYDYLTMIDYVYSSVVKKRSKDTM